MEEDSRYGIANCINASSPGGVSPHILVYAAWEHPEGEGLVERFYETSLPA
jgi:hypothetical protein